MIAAAPTSLRDAYICDAVRTPIGRFGGALAYVRTDDLAAIPLRALVARNPDADWSQLDEVILGCANQAGEDNRNVARMALLLAGLPVEIVAEYEIWRRIRDSEGTEGWVLHSLLSGRRTALIQPWAKGAAPPLTLLASADDKADTVARLQPGVIANVKTCDGTWCRVMIVLEGARDVNGFIRQEKLWGVYPNEKVD